MLDIPVMRLLALRLPGLFSGRALHHAALHATVAAKFSAADALFERAAARYLMDLEVESLARLRVHQAIARVRAAGEPRGGAMHVDVEARLSRLEWIESLVAPFDLVPASHLLARWLDHAPGLESAVPPPNASQEAA